MPYCELNDRKIFYDEKGFGIPIVFIHPPGMGRKVFYFQSGLSKHFRVIFPDLSGHGDSISSKKNITIKEFATEVKDFLTKLEIEKAVVCGYSSGGIIAQEFALNYPERTLGVILSGGFAEVESPVLKYEHILGLYFVKQFPKVLAYVIASSHVKDSSLRSMLIEHMNKADRHVWYNFYHESLHYSCLDRLHELRVPLLLIYGSRDLINQHERAYKKRVPHQTVIIKSVSHQIPMHKWQLFNQVLTGFVEDRFGELNTQKQKSY